MSIRRRILGVLDTMHKRLVRVENDAERNTATLDRNEQTLARIEQKLGERFDRLERAMVEQSKTLIGELESTSEQASRVGNEFHRHETAILSHEARLVRLE